MPNERARALRWAGEFIRELMATGELSDERKREALVILRHYPSTAEIDAQTKIGAWERDFAGPWLSAETPQPGPQLMQQDLDDSKANLAGLIAQCRETRESGSAPTDKAERKHARNVQIALLELGHDASLAVAAAVWRHHSNSLMASWMSGAETVASAKRTLLAYYVIPR
jgi:hypothetical protein